MGRTELAVWRVAGAQPEIGVVIDRPSPTAKVLVRWDDGREARVSPKDPVIRFAYQDSIRLKWLLDPDSFDEQFRSDPISVFVDALHDVAVASTWTALIKVVSEVHDSPAAVKAAASKIKKAFAAHPHVAATGDGKAYEWSERPYGQLWRLTPDEALLRLRHQKGILPEHLDVLVGVVKSGLCAH